MAAFPEDLTNIGEPRTNREVLQQIVHLIEENGRDRADDREMLERFVTKQDILNIKMDERLKYLEGCNSVNATEINTLKEQSKKWDIGKDIGGYLVGLGALITALIGLKGS